MAGSFFDGAQKALFDAVGRQFGQDGFWLTGAVETPGRVLLNEPTGEAALVADLNHASARITIEYRAGVFSGLREKVNTSGSVEKIRIGTRLFLVGSIEAKYDGATLVANVTEIK